MNSVWAGMSTPGGNEHVLPPIRSESGVHLEGDNGKQWLDTSSGLWNASLGFRNQAVADRVQAAFAKSSYGGVFRRTTEHSEHIASRLLDLWDGGPYSRLMYATSGSAAVDLAIKLARRYWDLAGSDRKIVVGLRGSYHGQTYGSLALSGDQLLQSRVTADSRYVRHIPHDDPELASKFLDSIGSTVAALFLEPVLGTGTKPLSQELLRELFRLREKHGFLIVADEVATGFGRTGVLFASAMWQSRADCVISSKALTNGTFAASVVFIADHIRKQFDSKSARFIHGETQAGSTAHTAAIEATLDEYGRLFDAKQASSPVKDDDRLLRTLTKIVDLGGQFIHVEGRCRFMTLEVSQDFISGKDGARYLEAIQSKLVERGVYVQLSATGLHFAPAHIFDDKHYAELERALVDVVKESQG